MALRGIKTADFPALRKKSRNVPNVDERTKELAGDLIDTMNDTPDGIGLASPQVGVLRRVFVMNLYEEGEEPTVCINPELVSYSGIVTELEGCLSVPGFYGYVSRPAKVKVRYTDLNGEVKEVEAEGLRARCFLHEIDHLSGIVCIDRMHQDHIWDCDKDEFVPFDLPYELRELKDDELYDFTEEQLEEARRIVEEKRE